MGHNSLKMRVDGSYLHKICAVKLPRWPLNLSCVKTGYSVGSLFYVNKDAQRKFNFSVRLSNVN